jgi:S-layer homology domain
MRLPRRLFKILFILGLSLLVSVSLILELPQAALSRTRSSIMSALELPRESQTQLASRTTFPDIAGHWAQGYIEALAAKDILVGYPDDKYHPDDLVTRAEFATIISKAFHPAVNRPIANFKDVDEGFWGSKSIQSAYQGEFLEGYPDNVFQPKQQIPRLQVLVSLANGLKLRSTGTQGTLLIYQDANSIPDYANEAISAATEQGLVLLNSKVGRLEPNREATRAEVAAFVYQSLTKVGVVQPIAPKSPYVVVKPETIQSEVIKSPSSNGGKPTSTPISPRKSDLKDPLPGSTTGGVPDNGINVFITNAGDIDGKPFSVGDEAIFKASAQDENGEDISNKIVWVTSENQVIGSGSNLVYPLNKVANETVIAKVKTQNGGEGVYKTSFTVSPSDIVLSRDVKVLPDPAQNNIVDLDLYKDKKICLKDDNNLPKIKVGDVLLGAGNILPPVKVLQIFPYEGNKVCMAIEYAALEDVFTEVPDKSITDGKGPIKLDYSFNGSKGVNFNRGADQDRGANKTVLKSKWPQSVIDCNQKGYEYRYNKRDDLSITNSDNNNTANYDAGRYLPSPSEILPDPNNQYTFDILNEAKKSDKVNYSGKKFTTASRTKQEYNIKSQAYFGLQFDPSVDGYIGFSLDKGLRLGLQGGANETVIGGITLDAIDKYSNSYNKNLASLEGLEAPRIAFSIGPIPVWIDAPLFLDFKWNSNFEAEVKGGVFGLLQTGFFDFEIKYENGFKTSGNADSLSGSMICGEFDISGNTKPALLPRVQFLLYSLAGPEIGLETYAEGKFSSPLRKVRIIQPVANSLSKKGAPIKLQADIGKSSKLPIKTSAGLNLAGQMGSVNRLIFPPYRLEIIGKKCAWRWCTDPVVVEFDVNKYFKKLTGFELKLGKIQKEISAEIPLSTFPFEQLSGVSMDDAYVVWKLDESEIGISNPSTMQDIQTQDLEPGKHKLEATVFAPLDTNLTTPLGSKSTNFNLE